MGFLLFLTSMISDLASTCSIQLFPTGTYLLELPVFGSTKIKLSKKIKKNKKRVEFDLLRSIY